jgi:hypothetical protein
MAMSQAYQQQQRAQGNKQSYKSPGGASDDYSLSVSEMNASLYNSSNRGAGIMHVNQAANTLMQGSSHKEFNMAPKFQY